MDSNNDVSSIFEAESNKLFSMVNTRLENPELQLSGIIETYYQIINVSSLATMMLQQPGMSAKSESLTSKIEKTQRFISEKFNSDLHHTVKKYLTDSIADITKDLQSSNALEKSKEDIESEAKLYEKLRETMSTKEFVDQYEQGLQSDD